MTIKDDADKIRCQLDRDANTIVRIALFGQPGAGKSSLVNKMLGKSGPKAKVGIETDTTSEAHAYEARGLRFIDLPGYGTAAFPKDSYFERFGIMSFDILLCISSGKLHQSDTEFFRTLISKRKSCIFVVNKHDEMWEPGIDILELERRKRKDICDHVGQNVNIIFTSCRNNTGLAELENEIQLQLTGAKRDRWTQGAKAYSTNFLQGKRAVCEKYVASASALAAANAINPIPGVDVALDLSIVTGLFGIIRDAYGLSQDALDSLSKSTVPLVARLAANITQLALKDGMLLLLKRYAGAQVAKTAAKYVPLIGQAIAASVGFAIVYNAGCSYLDICHDMALQILDHNLAAEL